MFFLLIFERKYNKMKMQIYKIVYVPGILSR